VQPGDLVVYYDPSGSTTPEPVLLVEICENFMDDLTGARVMNEMGIHWVPISDIGSLCDLDWGVLFGGCEEEN